MTITLLLYNIYIILYYAYIMAYGREMRRVIYHVLLCINQLFPTISFDNRLFELCRELSIFFWIYS